MKWGFLLSVIAVCLFIVSTHALAVRPYTLTDLANITDGPCVPRAINNAGQVVGDLYSHSFLWHNGVMEHIWTFGGPNSGAYDINELGQVVGSAEIPGGTRHAFLYENGVMHDLQTIGAHSRAWGINDSAQVTGWVRLQDGLKQVFLWENGAMTDIDTTERTSSGHSINNTGEIVGTSYGGGQITLWRDGEAINLGDLGRDGGEAWDINDFGQVVGYGRNRDGYTRAFFWSEGVISDLGSFDYRRSSGKGINNHGQIVGWSTFEGGGTTEYHASLWSQGEMYNLNELVIDASGWDNLEVAQDINDRGQIVGYGYKPESGGWRQGFLLTPIPEPSTIAVAVFGFLLALAKVSRK